MMLTVTSSTSHHNAYRLQRLMLNLYLLLPSSVSYFNSRLDKVTIRPEFFGTVPNFEGLSRKNTRSFGTLNCPEFRTLSRICPDLTSRCVAVQAVDHEVVHHFDVFARQICVLFSSIRTKSIFAPYPTGEVYDAPPDPLVRWGWRCPSSYLSLLDLGVMTASKSA